MSDEARGPRRSAAPIRCSFCGKPRSQVASIVAGPTPAVAICNECVELCAEIIAAQRGPLPPNGPFHPGPGGPHPPGDQAA
ncbi:MAG TPA: ClpX C4-type zinc finger protein [Solirubrobacteraceae bacterium]|nr:ClpX C4-type zinc finger protein [Solirubrobacteraceae bacterium]